LGIVVICLFACGVLSDYGNKQAPRAQILFDVANYLRQEDSSGDRQTREQNAAELRARGWPLSDKSPHARLWRQPDGIGCLCSSH
jgi:hypothetical protein